MEISDILQERESASAFGLISVDVSEKLSTALQTMANHKIHHLVVTQNSKVKGVISDRDILAKGLFPNKADFDASILVGDIMQVKIPRIHESTDLVSAMEEMVKCGVDAAFVVKNGKISALITESDFMRIFSQVLKDQSTDSFKGSKILLADPLVQRTMQALSGIGL